MVLSTYSGNVRVLENRKLWLPMTAVTHACRTKPLQWYHLRLVSARLVYPSWKTHNDHNRHRNTSLAHSPYPNYPHSLSPSFPLTNPQPSPSPLRNSGSKPPILPHQIRLLPRHKPYQLHNLCPRRRLELFLRWRKNLRQDGQELRG